MIKSYQRKSACQDAWSSSRYSHFDGLASLKRLSVIPLEDLPGAWDLVKGHGSIRHLEIQLVPVDDIEGLAEESQKM